MTTIQVGDRIEDASGSKGTVRYVGPVATSKDSTAIYYGIEWDEWGRGLNDGSVSLDDGSRHVYFDGPKPRRVDASLQFKCSFLKESKLQSLPPRCSLVDVLCDRYGHQSEDQHHHNRHGDDVMVTGQVSTLLGQNKPIQLVGVAKLRQQQTLESITKVSLAGERIAHICCTTVSDDHHPSTEPVLSSLTPNLCELDLANNLLSKCSQVLHLLQQLPNLHTLILTGNRIAMDVNLAADDNVSIEQFPQLKVLVLNQTKLSLVQVFSLVHRHFPQLQELHVASNGVTDDQLRQLDLPSALASVETLDLSDNALSDWTLLIQSLSKWTPSLTQLVLNDNRMNSLVINPPTAGHTLGLKSLSLTENLVDSWSSIDSLNRFASLDTLRLLRNPLIASMGVGEARLLIIARLSTLRVFNGSDVRVKERRDAETLYLKRILYELAACDNTTDAASDHQKQRVLATHPRVDELRARYPEVEISVVGAGSSATASTSALASSLVKVSIVPMSMYATSLTPIDMKIPEKMKLSQLKILIQNRLGLAPSDQSLSFRSDRKSMPIVIDDDGCEMGYYGIQDGAEILVNDAQ